MNGLGAAPVPLLADRPPAPSGPTKPAVNGGTTDEPPKKEPAAAGRAQPTATDRRRREDAAGGLRHDDSGRVASLLGTAPLLLGVATGATILIYLLPLPGARRWGATWEGPLTGEPEQGWWGAWDNLIAPLVGALLALIAVACFYKVRGDLSTPCRVNSRLFGEILGRHQALAIRHEAWCPAGATGTAATACGEARVHLDHIAVELAAGRGERWVNGAGFLNLWVRLHAADQALLVAAPSDDEVVAHALHDEMRLKDSAIDNSEDYLNKLRWAVCILGGARYLTPTPPLPQVVDADRTPEARVQARVVVRQVRHAIDAFRDARRGGLLRSRNQLVWAGLLTGLFAYMVLALAIVLGAHPRTITAAVAFYLVGAVIGLFDQLRAGAAPGADEDDFDLARTRLLYSPVLSGLAAVGGVLVTAMLYATLSGHVVTAPTVTAANEAAATAAQLEIPALNRIFDLREHRFGLVLAAVFGLTPGLLVDRLQGQANQYRADLQSTDAQNRAKP